MSMERRWVVYVLADPDTHQWRYVGFTVNFRNRYNAHLNSAREKNTPRACWIWALQQRGQRPSYEFLEVDIPTRQQAGEYERNWIAYLRSEGIALLNSTDGGEGIQNLSPEGREKLRVSKIGKLLSTVARARMREAAKHRPAPGPESIRKRAASLSRTIRNNPALIAAATERIRGYRASPEQLAKMSAANVGSKRSTEAIAKYKATRASWTPEKKELVRQRQRAGALAYNQRRRSQQIGKVA